MIMDFEVISPKTTEELLETIAANQGNSFRFGAGFTDLILDLKVRPEKDLTVVNLAQLNDDHFCGISAIDGGVRIGSLATAAQILDNDLIRENYPTLIEACDVLASMQIRQVATIGGNMCTASPSGDLICALVALEASCEILASDNTSRTVSIHDFFLGVRKTVLKKNEILHSIILPENSSANLQSNFIKIGTRASMECSVVSLACHIQRNDAGEIIKAGVAMGAVAPTVRFAEEACQMLIGKTEISAEDQELFADKVLERADPIDDIRGSAWYRKQVLRNISKSIVE